MSALIARLSLRHKLMLLCALAVLMAAAPITLVLTSGLQQLHAIQGERAAMPSARALLGVVRLMQEHRGLSNAFLSGDATRLPLMQERQAKLDAALQAAVSETRTLDDPPLSALMAKLRDDWTALHPGVHRRSTSAAESAHRHTDLVMRSLQALDEVVAVGGLALDADAESYFLIQTVLRDQPRLTEPLGLARARGAGMLIRGDTSEGTRLALSSLAQLAQLHATDAEGNLQRSVAARDAGVQDAELAQATKQAAEGLQQGLALIDRLIKQRDVEGLASTDYFASMTKVIEAQFALSDAALKRLGTLLDQREQAMLAQLWGMLAVLVGALMVGAWVAVMIIRGTTATVAQGMSLAQAIAQGDLSVQVSHSGNDEFGRMIQALGVATSRMRETLLGIRAASEAVASAAGQIAQGNQDLSARTENQASSLEQTASSMEEMSGTVQNNASTALQASQMAQGAAQDARSSGQVFAQVVGKMSEIRQTSARIAEINSVIDGIAFQTNILALNAAVEAARAGEQGRGFAVVASEVRTLAQRSAQAAREIKTLIQTSVDSVEQGYELATRSGESVDSLVQQVQKVSEFMDEIASASEQQNLGIQQVNQAVTNLDESTQQNAALVEESSAAAMSLSEQAMRLQQSVAGFRLS